MLNLIILHKWTLHLQLVQLDKQPENLCSHRLVLGGLFTQEQNDAASLAVKYWSRASTFEGLPIAIAFSRGGWKLVICDTREVAIRAT